MTGVQTCALPILILDDERWWGSSRSHTFHGRDLFAPVAAHLAAGVPFGDLGTAISPTELVPAATLPIEVAAGVLHTSVRIVDGFGTLVLTGDRQAI